MKRIAGYKIHDAGTALGALASHFVAGDLVVGGTADTDKSFPAIPKRKIKDYVLIAAVTADVAWTQTFTPATFTVGNEFVLTIQYPDSRQRIRKVFKHTVVTGDTATTVCNIFRDAINGDDSLPITATGTTTLILTADTAGAGVNPIAESGATGASTFTGGAVTADAEATDAAYWESKYEGVDADDFGSATLFYDAYVFSYYVDVNVGHGISQELQKAILFTESTVVGTSLDDALAGDYAFVADGVGVDGNLAI